MLAAGIGEVISHTMFIAGATGGCGAEIGSSAAMAAAAVCELLGGDARQAVHAAALALVNTIGLVCDPVGGYVEVPCVSRNAFYSVHAVSAAQLARAGLTSVIPPMRWSPRWPRSGGCYRRNYAKPAKGASPTRRQAG